MMTTSVMGYCGACVLTGASLAVLPGKLSNGTGSTCAKTVIGERKRENRQALQIQFDICGIQQGIVRIALGACDHKLALLYAVLMEC
jgi:hypothetical protein